MRPLAEPDFAGRRHLRPGGYGEEQPLLKDRKAHDRDRSDPALIERLVRGTEGYRSAAVGAGVVVISSRLKNRDEGVEKAASVP